MGKTITGFSKLDKIEKINWLTEAYFNGDKRFVKILSQYWNNDQKLQTLHDKFIENTITNFYLPLGIAPNFEIDSKTYAIPMVIEESSVKTSPNGNLISPIGYIFPNWEVSNFYLGLLSLTQDLPSIFCEIP